MGRVEWGWRFYKRRIDGISWMGLITLGIDPNQIQGQLAQCNLSVALETEYALAVETWVFVMAQPLLSYVTLTRFSQLWNWDDNCAVMLSGLDLLIGFQEHRRYSLNGGYSSCCSSGKRNRILCILELSLQGSLELNFLCFNILTFLLFNILSFFHCSHFSNKGMMKKNESILSGN